MSNIARLFFEQARSHPERVAIIHGAQRVTYGELAKQAEATAAGFMAQGLSTGDRVLVLVPMGIDLYRVVLALFRMGAVAVFLDAWVSRERLELCCELADVRAWVGGWKARLLALVSRPLRCTPIRLRISPPSGATTPLAAVDPDQSALITFTTGSTGTPKAARRSHGFLARQFEALLDELEPTEGDTDLTTLPIVLFINLGLGSTTVIPAFKPSAPERFSAGKVVQQILLHGVDRMTVSPIHAHMLADHVLRTGSHLTALKKLFTGGGPVFPGEAQRIVRAFPDARCTIVYGSTEAEPISSINAAELVGEVSDEGLCVGRVFHRASVRIIPIADEAIFPMSSGDFDAFVLPEGLVGEIIVSGAHVLASYYNNEEAYRRNKIIVDGVVWHRTGDSGRLSKGVLYMLGRCAQLIPHRDGYIAPFVWEPRLKAIDGVERGTLIGREGRIIAVLQPARGVDRGTLISRAETLCPFVDEVRLIKELPTDPRHRSKIDHEALQRNVY
ncbi:MAG: AMP-binding protein [Flavobacteriales bacterium]|nr:AMP-binding protein [Flavobacteriales bacterium]